MSVDLITKIDRLECQVQALAHLLSETLDLLRNSALESYQQQERQRCAALIETAKSIKKPQSSR